MNIDRINAAASRTKGHVRHTPLLRAPLLDAAAGRRVWVKPECLQLTGSFKFRGAWAALSALSPQKRAQGVIAFSSGNHAQGVALAARLHRVPAVIVMPSDAPQIKIDNTRSYGAEVVLYDRATESREALGMQLAKERGLHLVKPFDDPEVIAGQGTVGLEIAAQASEIGLTRADVLVCCGGGGLTAGIALALETKAPGLRTRPVEPEGFDDVARSLKAGRIRGNDHTPDGLCDAILTPEPGTLTFPILARLCGPGIAVREHDVLRAMATAFRYLKITAEPGGAVALAAALYHRTACPGEDIIAVVTGGNVEPNIFARALHLKP